MTKRELIDAWAAAPDDARVLLLGGEDAYDVETPGGVLYVAGEEVAEYSGLPLGSVTIVAGRGATKFGPGDVVFLDDPDELNHRWALRVVSAHPEPSVGGQQLYELEDVESGEKTTAGEDDLGLAR